MSQEFHWDLQAANRHSLVTHYYYYIIQQWQKLLLDVVADLEHCSVTDKIINELDTLIKQSYFNQFDHSIDFDILNFNHVFYTIEKAASTWHIMLL